MGQSANTPASSQIVSLESQLDELQKSHELLQSFYNLTVMERDYERRKYDELKASLAKPNGLYSDIVSDGGMDPR
jgi:hypothetical protein